MAISQMLALLIQTFVLGEAINCLALDGNFGLSVMAHNATWVSSKRFKPTPRP